MHLSHFRLTFFVLVVVASGAARGAAPSNTVLLVERSLTNGHRLLLCVRPFTTNDFKELTARDTFAKRFARKEDIPAMREVFCDDVSPSGDRLRLWHLNLGMGFAPLPDDWPEPHSDLPAAWEALDFNFDPQTGLFFILYSVFDQLAADCAKCPPYPGQSLLSGLRSPGLYLGGGVNLRKVKEAHITRSSGPTLITLAFTNGQQRVFEWQTNAWAERKK